MIDRSRWRPCSKPTKALWSWAGELTKCVQRGGVGMWWYDPRWRKGAETKARLRRYTERCCG